MRRDRGKQKVPSRIPKFHSIEEEARFWDTHSFTDYLDELKPAKHTVFPKPRKRLISLRVEEAQIQELKRLATRRGIGYQTLMRLWVTDRLAREEARLHRRVA